MIPKEEQLKAMDYADFLYGRGYGVFRSFISPKREGEITADEQEAIDYIRERYPILFRKWS